MFRDRIDASAAGEQSAAAAPGTIALLNGETAGAEDLRALALVNYGHFTTMEARGGAVRGLDLHLARLDAATRELFGAGLDPAAVRADLRAAIDAGFADAVLRVTVFSRRLDRERMTAPQPDVLVTAVSAGGRGDGAGPMRVASADHERTLAHLKHVGTFDLFHHRHRARAAGFDDALFVDRTGAICEGTVWNIGFIEGDAIVWPDAPMLAGISMQLLQRGLRARGIESRSERVARADLARFGSAFACNALQPVRPIAGIDGTGFAIDRERIGILEDAYASNLRQPI